MNELSQATQNNIVSKTQIEFSPEVARLRKRVQDEIGDVAGKLEKTNDANSEKDSVRQAHLTQRSQLLIEAEEFISEKEEVMLEQFAAGSEINPSKIDPYVVPVRTPFEVDLFRYASLQWSVPVSAGYGRRNKFLVKVRQNGKLIGIFALGDPVINLGPRDQTVGWTADDRKYRLYNVLDAFVLGAVGPYRELLGGKLVGINDFRGVADPVEVVEFDEKAVVLAENGGEINTSNLIPTHIRTNKYEQREIEKRIEEIKNMLRTVLKMPYDNGTIPDEKELYNYLIKNVRTLHFS